MIDELIPASLALHRRAPVFLLRQAPQVHIGAISFRRMCGLVLKHEGCSVSHSQAELRAAALDELRAMWAPDEYDRGAETVIDLWRRVDAHEPISDRERAALDDLSARLGARPCIREMLRQNIEHARGTRFLAAAMVVAGWRGLNVPRRMEGGSVPFATLAEVEQELLSIDDDAGAAAWTELTNECAGRLVAFREAPRGGPTQITTKAPAVPDEAADERQEQP